MKIAGKDRSFELNVQSHEEIARMCPGEDMANMALLFNQGSIVTMQTTIKIAIALNRGYEDHRHFDDPEHHPEYLTEDMFKFMSLNQIRELEEELTRVMNEGNEVTVEGEAPKSSGKNAEEAEVGTSV